MWMASAKWLAPFSVRRRIEKLSSPKNKCQCIEFVVQIDFVCCCLCVSFCFRYNWKVIRRCMSLVLLCTMERVWLSCNMIRSEIRMADILRWSTKLPGENRWKRKKERKTSRDFGKCKTMALQANRVRCKFRSIDPRGNSNYTQIPNKPIVKKRI